MTTAFPYWRRIDWSELEAAYPPPPGHLERLNAMSDDELRTLKEARLSTLLAEAWAVPFYKERWSEAGVELGDLKGLEMLHQLPAFTSDDLASSIASVPPFGKHYPSSLSDSTPIKIGTSGGTRGFPRVLLYDAFAWEVQGIQGARGLWAQGGRAGDILQTTYTLALANAGWLAYQASRWLGAIPLTTGSGQVTPSEKQLEFAAAWGTSIWFTHAEYLRRLASVAADIGFDLHALPTKFLHTYLGYDPDGVIRRNIEHAWNAPLFDNYGTNELGLVAFECTAHDLLHAQDDMFVLETVDLDTDVPVSAGVAGNLIATSLYRRVPPLIRFNVQDRFSLHGRSQCACGLRTSKLSHFLGRSDEMIKLRGQNVWPRACQTVVLDNPDTTGEFLCVAETIGEGLRSATRLTIRVERRNLEVQSAALQRSLVEALRDNLGVTVDVEIVDPDSLAPLTGLGREGKVKRLLDLRRQD